MPRDSLTDFVLSERAHLCLCSLQTASLTPCTQLALKRGYVRREGFRDDI